MQSKVFMALAMASVALAGCTSEPSEVGFSFEAPNDPVTEAFHFHATGPGESFTWNFGDGMTATGKDVEHVFGFTDGAITVRVNAADAAGEEVGFFSEEIILGSGQNTEPLFAYAQSKEWVLPGEPLTISGLGTSDADNDPLLYRFECSRVELGPPHDDGHPDSLSKGPVPFDVESWALVDASIPDGEQVSGDFCKAFNFENSIDFTRTGAFTGSFTEPGGYKIDVEIRDPKMNKAWRARAQVFVTDDKPSATPAWSESGSLSAGVAGTALEDLCANAPELCDNQATVRIPLFLPFSNGTASLSFTDAQATGTFSVTQGQNVIGSGAAGESVALDDLAKSAAVTVVIRMDVGVSTDYTFDMGGDYTIDPYLKYKFTA